jgi:glycosyltransferase involved in cell wall biosynthesis
MDRSRFEPHIASYRAEGIRFDELKSAGVPIVEVPFRSLKSLTAISAAIQVRRYIRENNIRLVHAYDPSAVFVVPLAKSLRVPAVLSSTVSYRDLLDPRTRRQVRWTDSIVDRVVVNCEAMRKHMIEDEHLADERVELCYNGVDTTQFYPGVGNKPEELADAPLIIGAVCVLRPEKALDLLQAAFARVRHLKPGIKLVIIGSGPELPKLRANSKYLGIENDCHFFPDTPKVPDLLRVIDIFVLCSRSEAFSNALLESMACGCCAVGSRLGGTPELLGNDERGILFRPGDVEDLAEKLAFLIGNEHLRRKVSQCAVEFARKHLNVEIAAQRMAEIYEATLCSKAAA